MTATQRTSLLRRLFGNKKYTSRRNKLKRQYSLEKLEDRQMLTAEIELSVPDLEATEPIVSTDPPSDTGQFRFHRNTTDASLPLTVNFSVSSISQYVYMGMDYDFSPAVSYDGMYYQITIPANEVDFDLDVLPKFDTDNYESGEDVQIDLQSGTDYTVSSMYYSGSVLINQPDVVGLWASDNYATESGDTGSVTLYRSNTNDALEVQLSVTGDAQNYSDYSMGAMEISPGYYTATFNPGQSYLDIFIYPIPDPDLEFNEFVYIELVAPDLISSEYFVDSMYIGMIEIQDSGPTVWVESLDDSASEDGDKGIIRIRRSSAGIAQYVGFSLSGSAYAYSDYTTNYGDNPYEVYFGETDLYVDLEFTAHPDTEQNESEYIQLQLWDSSEYQVDSFNDYGYVYIVDSERVVSIIATDYEATEGVVDTAYFYLQRSGTTGELTVSINALSTGSTPDFELSSMNGALSSSNSFPMSVTFPDGQNYVYVDLQASVDSDTEGTEYPYLYLETNSTDYLVDQLYNTAYFTIYDNSFSSPPTPQDDTFDATEDLPNQLIDVLWNDTDPDGDLLTISSVAMAVNGMTSVSGNMISYTPNANFAGTDSFTYYVTDNVTTVSATVTVNVLPTLDDAPFVEVALPSVNLPLGSYMSAFNLGHYFADNDSVPIESDSDIAFYEIYPIGQTAADFAESEISGHQLSLMYDSNATGIAQFLVVAVDYAGLRSFIDIANPGSADPDHILTINLSGALPTGPLPDGGTWSGVEDSTPIAVPLETLFNSISALPGAPTFDTTGNVVYSVTRLENRNLVLPSIDMNLGNANEPTLLLDPLFNAFGAVPLSLRATDDAGQTLDTEITVDVAGVNDPPVQLPIGNGTFTVGQTMNYSVDQFFTDPDIYDVNGNVTDGLLYDPELTAIVPVGTAHPSLLVNEFQSAEFPTNMTFNVSKSRVGEVLVTLAAKDISGTVTLSEPFSITIAGVLEERTPIQNRIESGDFSLSLDNRFAYTSSNPWVLNDYAAEFAIINQTSNVPGITVSYDDVTRDLSVDLPTDLSGLHGTTASISFQVSDGYSGLLPVSFDVMIEANNPPVASSDNVTAFTTQSGQVLQLQVLDNDTTDAGETLSILSIAGPANATKREHAH
jgi:hypothetical protein